MATITDHESLVDVKEGYAFGFHDEDKAVYKTKRGVDHDIIDRISDQKQEPDWMRTFRHQALDIFFAKPLPTWGADLSGIDFEEIFYYSRSSSEQGKSWDDVPEAIKNTFERLGIPQAERKFLAGVGAQYDSEVVYHSLREEWEKIGVLFLDMDTGLREHEDLVREYFATIIPAADNKFAALNSAVWSGGSFVYVPKGVHVDIPLQAYFRINTENMGQFERTLIIVEEGASMHYVEGCTAPIYSSNSLHSAVVEIIVKKGGSLPLHHHPKLEHRCLQPGDQARDCPGKRDHGMDRRQSRQ
jgi:Fe-S cluster assembly protein SufB